jgi:hypothetical protein
MLPFNHNDKRIYCSEKCRVASYRNRKQGWELLMVERHENHLDKFLKQLGDNFKEQGVQFDDASRYFLIRKLEHGDSLSEADDRYTGCWRIYVKPAQLEYFLKYRKHPVVTRKKVS